MFHKNYLLYDWIYGRTHLYISCTSDKGLSTNIINNVSQYVTLSSLLPLSTTAKKSTCATH